jgi:hypothetical protein
VIAINLLQVNNVQARPLKHIPGRGAAARALFFSVLDGQERDAFDAIGGAGLLRRGGEEAVLRVRVQRDEAQPRRANSVGITVLLQSAADTRGPQRGVAGHALRQFFFRNDVGDRQTPAGFEHARRFAEHRGLVGREVDHAVADDHVDAVVVKRRVFDVGLVVTDLGEAVAAPIQPAFGTMLLRWVLSVLSVIVRLPDG